MNRRDFVKTSAAGLLSLAAAPYLYGATGQNRHRVGVIGCGWFGKVNLLRFVQVAPVEVVALCDVDRKMLADAPQSSPAGRHRRRRPRTYTDYREMLKEKDLDIVIVGTPDHWHALPMIAAMEAGADVYLQKPISVDVVEGQAMVAAASKHGRVVQVGTQRRSTPHLIEARDRIIREGKLGRIGLVEIYCYYHMRNRSNPPDTQAAGNAGLGDVDRPAPMRPFNPIVHPRGWRAFKEYGNGIMGDMCVHMLDMRALDAGAGLAEQDQFHRRHLRRQGEQGQHLRHADGDLRLRRPERSSGSTAPGARRSIRSIPGA